MIVLLSTILLVLATAASAQTTFRDGSRPHHRHGHHRFNPHSPDNALSFGAACAIQI
jgi:hypothetical protein